MAVIEMQFAGGVSKKIACDFCNEVPENGVLIEKPNSMIANGQVIVFQRPEPLHICLDCLVSEVENI